MPSARTLEQARAALFDALDVDAVLSVVDSDGAPVVVKVFDYEPLASETLRPAIVSIFATGIQPDWWQFSVRAYHTLAASPQDAQRNLDRVILGVENALDTAGVVSVGPSEWTITLLGDQGILLAESNVVIGREDF